MRTAFINTLTELAKEDRRIVLLTGDLGFMAIEPFAKAFPERFINVGVAEQNMVGIATGLAEAGYIPFVYSIATFASMRGYEFIRNGPALHRLPVRIVGIGDAFGYGNNGPTHYALEDVGILRQQPDLTVLVPFGPGHASGALRASFELPRPIYYRIAKGADAPEMNDIEFELGRLSRLREGPDALILGLGPAVANVLDAADLLAQDGVDVAVAGVSSFNPLSAEDLVDAISAAPLVVTVESHYRVGGLGTAVAEVMADYGVHARLLRCGPDSMPRGVTGKQSYMEHAFGISAAAIHDAVASALAV
jgi:transketolase